VSVWAGLTAVAALALPPVASAHVLDEYLQATRIDLERDGLILDLELTPGVEIAPVVFGTLDTNRDGRLSHTECHEYARRVVRDLRVTGERPLSVTLLEASCPAFEAVQAGVGTIRVRATSPLRIDRPGRHRLVYRNLHDPARAAYVVNALVPAVGGVTITALERDPGQSELALSYVVAPRAGAGAGLRYRPLLFFGFAAWLVLSIANRRAARSL
jgi:hypothetical protein